MLCGLGPAAWLGVIACVGFCSSSRSVSGVEKCSRFGLGLAVDIGVSCAACVPPSLVPPGCVGGVVLKKVWIGGDPLVPAPLHSFKKFGVLMTLC